MRRRDFVLGGTAVFALQVGQAQAKMPVVGLLWNDSVKPSPLAAVLLDALRDKGWAAGHNLRVEDRVSLEGYAGYDESVAALVQAKVDVIVAYGTTAVFAAAKATKEIPIVMHMGADPVQGGLAASLARPGGNVTGILNTATALTAKRIQLLKEMNPALTTVGVVLSPNVANPVYRRDSEATARELRLQVHFVQVNKADEIDTALAELAKKRVGALFIAPSSMLQAHGAHVVGIVAKHRLPAVYGSEQYAAPGGLMIYGSSGRKGFVRVAAYVDRVLKGARPAEMAIEQVSDMELKVNARTAKSLGIKIPTTILVRADQVIE